MAFDGLLDAEGKPKYNGQSPEVGGVKNQPGLYVHPQTGARLITAPGSKGVPHADAFVRLGYERKGPVPTPVELREMQQAQLKKDKEAEAAEKAAEGGQSASGSGTAALKKQIEAAEEAKKKAEERAKAAEERATQAEKNAEAALELAKKAEAGNGQDSTGGQGQAGKQGGQPASGAGTSNDKTGKSAEAGNGQEGNK